ncbi:Endonuclease/exonuclease/phosphatase [Rippkaea orientalis PCC 8801]|uniref:Endonuclease/exonuclease/phosphatase n=1 Tax=Rippkaea orientalis (strain PCC 8801 / RF-1) TaxID=41431 RepID=B7K341_RIPO1|nr:endonuclease/exonuclease/phosphatase family protein [Rippkaea orientalis]ACK64361.1 Endonuclease/exonuclease/phosphatase [Rippkaea orientalis PCC 8801]
MRGKSIIAACTAIAQTLKILLYGLLILTGILSVGILFWRSYPLELLCNFRVYYLLLAIGIAIALMIYSLKGWRVRLGLYLALALVAFNSMWILPWYLPHTQQGWGYSMRVMTFNININNQEWDAIADAVRRVKPDVATIMESSVEAKEALRSRLANQLPFVYRASGGGLTILSRFPLVLPQSKTFKNGTVLMTFLRVNHHLVHLIAAHPIVPIKPSLFQRRNGFLAELTGYVQQQLAQDPIATELKKSLIFLGDFNLTPWSPYYGRLIRATGLHNTRLGFGIEPSWIEAATHVHYPGWMTAIMKIPIDHILVSSDMKVADCKTAQAANSDHRILWSDLVF